MTEELLKIASEMRALLPHFKDGGPVAGLILPTEYSSSFKAMATEARDIIDEELRPFSDYSIGLARARDSGEGSFFGGPTYVAVEEAAKLIAAAHRAINRRAAKPPFAQTSMPHSYVSTSRMAEMKALPQGNWDFTRLIELCREPNVASANDCHMATGFLLRSILNHVPPVFGFDSFARVASEHPFAKSVKASILRLQGQGRDGADFHLHQPIRKHETLPSATQVAFSPELDVLLGEVIRVAREAEY